MAATFFQFLSAQGFVTLFFVLGVGHLVGRVKLGFFSPGSTAGSLLVALVVGSAAFQMAGVHFQIPDLVQTIFLALFTYAIGLRVGPQFVEGMRKQGFQLVVLVMVTTTTAFLMAVIGSRALGLGPGFAPGILSGSNTISAVMGVATAAVDQGLFNVPAGLTANEIKANIAAGYSVSYILSILGIVLLVRNLPALFGIDAVKAAKEAEKRYGAKGHALPGTSDAFTVGMQPVGIRVYQLTNKELVGRRVKDVGASLNTPILRVTRNDAALPLTENPALAAGDLLTIAGAIKKLVGDTTAVGPEVDNEAARHVDVDQAEIVLSNKAISGKTVADLQRELGMQGIRLRALFRDGHELPLLTGTPLQRHDVLRVIGMPSALQTAVETLGQAVRPTNTTDIITLALGIATGYAVGLITIPVAGIPIGLGAMGGVVVAGMVVSILRSINPAFGGPMPEGARAFLESIGVDLFVCGLGLNVAPALVDALSHGMTTIYMLLLGLATATIPTFISWLVGLYILRMDPIILAGAVAGARNSTTAMRAISERSKSAIPSFGYPVTYALSTVVFLVYGYLAMLLT
jgi:putative transport protein